MADKLWSLWENGQYGLTRIELDANIYGCEVVKKWEDLYFGSHIELPDAIYKTLYEMLNPLVKEAGLEGLCMTDKQIEFSFDWTYGYVSALYCVRQANDVPFWDLTTQEFLKLNNVS